LALALQVNSPGGSPVQSALIAKRIRNLAKENDLPVFAFVEDVAASGGYWLACAADEIYAERSSIVGSIGVVSAGFGFEEAIKKIGVERRLYHQGRNKAMLDPFKPEDPEDVERLYAIQKDIHETFIDHVKDRRGKRLKGEDDDLFNGDIWTGQRALELGLIDGIGDLRSVMRDRFGEKVQLRVVGGERSWLKRRLGLTGRPIVEPEVLVSGALAAIEERALWSRFGL
jgi:signal peptide peptidase SppA